jgi:poly(A) polymerase
MEKALQIQKQVQEILGTDEVYLVGGSVRDIVMGQPAKDYDFTTPMLPEEMIEKVKAAGRRVYTIGEKFGTIGFKVPVDTLHSEEPFERVHYEYVEVTTFRSEVYTSKSRKPEVEFVKSLDEDLARRDFTMNAMVLKGDGSIYDPYGGRLDIHAKKIVTVGMPKDRIIEDPLRIFRAARFAARYGFVIDPNFIGKARQLADRIFDVSVERWVIELDKLLTSKDAYGGLDALAKMGVYSRILPEMYSDESHINPFDCCGDVEVFEDADIAWKFLLSHQYSPNEIKEASRSIRFVNSGICQRFKFSNERTDKILDKAKKKV